MRMIVALEDSGQISAAAHVLNISQPAASRMIAEMEDILGVPLCRRLPRGVELTPFGAALARRARTMLLELREVDREISDLKSGKGGAVFLGAVTAPAIGLAVPAIRRIRKNFPRIEISVQVDTSGVLARELLASRHDFIIARIPDDLNPRLFDARVIGIEKACLIVRRGHPLADGRTVELEQLTNYDWVFQPGGSLLRRTIETIFMSRNVPLPDRILNTTSLLADAGDGGAVGRDRAGRARHGEIHQRRGWARRGDRDPADILRHRRAALQPDHGAQPRALAGRKDALRPHPGGDQVARHRSVACLPEFRLVAYHD